MCMRNGRTLKRRYFGLGFLLVMNLMLHFLFSNVKRYIEKLYVVVYGWGKGIHAVCIIKVENKFYIIGGAGKSLALLFCPRNKSTKLAVLESMIYKQLDQSQFWGLLLWYKILQNNFCT